MVSGALHSHGTLVTRHRAIMFHIGVATQHPPLPEPSQLSELGIDFIRKCLTIDPMQRPTAAELMEHPWMQEFAEVLRNFQDAELATSPPAEMPSDPALKHASVARQAAIEREKPAVPVIAERQRNMASGSSMNHHGAPTYTDG